MRLNILIAAVVLVNLLLNQESFAELSHISKSLSNNMTDIGKVSEETTIPVTFALKLNNEDELDARIAEMYRVGSNSFHEFITPDEFRARYAPTQDQINTESDFLKANGISIQSISENHVFIRGKAKIGSLNKTFSTELHHYFGPDRKHYFGPAKEVHVPNGSRIMSAIGLSNLATLKPHFNGSNAPVNRTSSDQPRGLSPADIRKIYNIPDNLDGRGQTLALLEFDAYDENDIRAYEKAFNLPNTPLQNIYVDGADNQSPGDAQIEVSMDIEMMAALAPKASKILIYEGPISDASMGGSGSIEVAYIDIIEKIASDNLAAQISASWGTEEGFFSAAELQAENLVFKQMAAQGQSFFASSGDLVAKPPFPGDKSDVQNPASQPYVTAVGGTTLKLDSQGIRESELAWIDSMNFQGTGGGISDVWSIPSYQVGAATADAQASTTMRNVPDVALNADGDKSPYAVYNRSAWTNGGGTSASAPLWAAFNALINQQRMTKGLSNIGFLNPALYDIGKGTNYSKAFFDITNFDPTSSTLNPVLQPAKIDYLPCQGYDNVTGWGSFNGRELIGELSQH